MTKSFSFCLSEQLSPLQFLVGSIILGCKLPCYFVHTLSLLKNRSRTLLLDENSACSQILCCTFPFPIIDPIFLVLGSLTSWQDEDTSYRFSQSVAQVWANRLLSPVKTLEQLGFFSLSRITPGSSRVKGEVSRPHSAKRRTLERGPAIPFWPVQSLMKISWQTYRVSLVCNWFFSCFASRKSLNFVLVRVSLVSPGLELAVLPGPGCLFPFPH